jgi:hypothetical protein
VKHRAPTPTDHQRFCELEGWHRVRDARGRSGTHHLTYELLLPDGRLLRTRISHPADRSTYGPSLWAHILRDQLSVDESEFWACVNDGLVPDRGDSPRPRASIPSEVVYQLVVRFHVPEEEVARMTKAAAIARLQQLWGELSEE